LAVHGAAAPAGAVVARALSDEGDDPRLTDKVDPPVSERVATAKSEKRSRPGLLTGWTHLSARGRRRPNQASSEREATAESDKQSRPALLTGWTHLSARGR
jgi:hypothetical protein